VSRRLIGQASSARAGSLLFAVGDGGRPTQAEAQLRRYELLKSLVNILWVVSLWVPLQAARPIAETFAGKDTNVEFTLTVSLGISVALGAGLLAQLTKARAQRDELRRLRRRISDLEEELAQAKGR
jgi:hypothetical protein